MGHWGSLSRQGSMKSGGSADVVGVGGDEDVAAATDAVHVSSLAVHCCC